MKHPFLEDPENLRAFQQLIAVPTGSVRKWEQLLGWKPGRMQRYLASLSAYGLAKVESCKQHSVFRPLIGVADCSVVSRGVALPKSKGSALDYSQPSLRQKPRPGKAAQQPGAELLIDAMNRSMQRFDSYLPVRADNFGSHRAAKRWLVDEQIPLEEAVTLVYRAAEGFDLDLAPGHDYPTSIAYFSKKVVSTWHAIQRSRNQLGLFPQMEVIRVPEPEGRTAAPAKVATVPEPPPPTQEEIAQMRAEFERIAAGGQAERLRRE